MTEGASSSFSPLTPPLDEEDRLSWLRLIRSRKVGVATFYRLMNEHGSATAALDALPRIAADAGIEDYTPCPIGVAVDEMKRGRVAGARLICRGEEAYPKSLTDLSDAPPLIWSLGQQEALARPMVALVGARNASSLGLRMARRLAADLVDAGYVIASGLARGVDTAAHEAALGKGETPATLAVLAGGADVIYPKENASLAQEISERGLRISEAPIGLVPQARHFPPRNRIIAGLAKAVVVVEAAAKSGSLITARAALDAGRDVLAVPGHPFDGRASGCNFLIRDGATLVQNAADVLEAIGPAEAAPQMVDAAPALPLVAPESRSAADIRQLHAAILDRLGPSPVAEDQLIRDMGGRTGDVGAGIVELETLGHIRRQPGGLLALSEPR